MQLIPYEDPPCIWNPPGRDESNDFWSLYYKERGLPTSRCLIASDGDRVIVLEHIGPDMDFLARDNEIELYLSRHRAWTMAVRG